MMNSQVQTAFGRHTLIWGALFFCVGALFWRLAELQVVEDDFLQNQGDRRAIRTLPLQSYRGMMLDRNGEALAISTPVQSIWVNPKQLDVTSPHWQTICQKLGVDAQAITQEVLSKKHKTFVYVRRHIPPNVAHTIQQLNVPGVYSQKEFRRYYPAGEVSAQLLGTTNIDQVGLEGLELAYQDILSGRPGEKTVLRNRHGDAIENIRQVKNAQPGQDMVLSIDSRIQYLAYKELLKATRKHQAKSGTVVVMNVDTFEILAMASAPSYNPNTWDKPADGRLRNRAVTDQFEPGSLMKPFSMAAVLASGDVYPHTTVNTAPGWVKVGNQVVRDVRNFGKMDLETVIKKSSNVGISKLTLAHPAENLYKMLHLMGFGMPTQSDFPGEVAGKIQYDGKSNPFALATLAFGYGISATPLQLAQAYGILAANGVRKPVSFIKKQGPDYVEQVIPPGVAQAVNHMLVKATDFDGTAHAARVPGYTVAGKTGTARKIGPNGYLEDSHIALFAGFAPANNPKLVMVVIIDEPSQGQYYGGQVAAPVFSKVMQGALRLLDVAPNRGVQPELILVKK